MSTTPWGVDLSPTYNPVVDAAAIKAAGASYAICKVSEGVGWPSEHTPEFDWFARVAADVAEAGLELRVYHLATPLDERDAVAEATWFDRHLAGVVPTSIAYDLEKLAPGIAPSKHVAIYDAWQLTITGFWPGVPIELYCDRSVIEALEPFLPTRGALWLAFPGWTPAEAEHLGDNTMRVQIGQRMFPTMPEHPIDIDVSPNATNGDVAEALGRAAPSTPPAPAPKPPTPQANSDWSLAVHTLDLRNADTTPVRGDSVKALQTLLNLDQARLANLALDGIGGPATRDALLRFQSERRLAVDGVAGPQTWEALCTQ